MTERRNGILLFRNNRKTGEKDPDLRGSDGQITCPVCDAHLTLWASGWTRLARNGSKFLALSFRLKSEQADAETAAAPAPSAGVDDDPLDF